MSCTAAMIKCVVVAALAVHPGHHHAHHYTTVRPGDTLSSISRREYGHASRWPALWWVNRKRVRNPDSIRAGERLALTRWHPKDSGLERKALARIPAPPPPKPAPPVQQTVPQAPAVQPPPSVGAPPQGSPPSGGMSAYQRCVMQRESGGNPDVMNGSGHYGLYQFSYSAWVQAGGNPADFGHASVAEQNAAFHSLYSQLGTSPWSPSDGC